MDKAKAAAGGRTAIDTETVDEGERLWKVWCAAAATPDFRTATHRQWRKLVQSVVDGPDIPIFQSAKYDMAVIENDSDIRFTDWRDTILEAHWLGHKPLNLGSLSSVFNGVPLDKAFVKNRKKVPYDTIPDEVLRGCSLDAWATAAYHERHGRRIEDKWPDLYAQERKFTRVLMAMEARGLPMDEKRIAIAHRELIREMGQLEVELQQLGISDPSNIEGIGHKFWRGKRKVVTTKTGKLSTQAKVMKDNASSDDKVWVKKLIKWRQADKFLSTNLRHWYGHDRLFINFNQTGTLTWRLSADKGAQTLSTKNPHILHIFEAPPGMVFVSADYSQIELRMLANLSQDPKMMAAYLSGSDLHQATVDHFNLLSYYPDAAQARSAAKVVNFGMAYGITAYGLQGRVEGLTEELGQEFIDLFFDTYKEVLPWQATQLDRAQRTGYVETWQGRPLWIPGMFAGDTSVYSHAVNQTKNYAIQGGAFEVIKEAMLRVEGEMLNTVHDSLDFLVEERHAKDFKHYLEETLPYYDHDIPYTVEVKTGKTLGDLKSIENPFADMNEDEDEDD